MWQFIVQGFAGLIHYLYELTAVLGVPNYGLAIILVTIVIKAAMYPLTNKQMKSMRQMQQIQPKMKVIQEKYRDDPQRMQKEMMDLYKEHGVSPLSGCLPLIIQLPILMAFYQALQYGLKSQAVQHASFLWVADLSQPDRIIFPLLAGITTFIQQKVSTIDATDPTQKTMLYTMPLFIAWMAGTFPAGLALYWVMFNVLSIAQQMWINARGAMPAAATATLDLDLAAGPEPEIAAEAASKGGKGEHGVGRKKRKKR